MTFLSFCILVILLISLVVFLGGMFSKKLVYDKEKMSPFECGFTPKFNARLPFSMRFFLISLVFLIFDVELVLMFPFISNILMSSLHLIFLGVLSFTFILILGLAHEWNQGSLDWVN